MMTMFPCSITTENVFGRIEVRRTCENVRENRDGLPSKRVRVELPLKEDQGDEIVWLGLHGQAVEYLAKRHNRRRKRWRICCLLQYSILRIIR